MWRRRAQAFRPREGSPTASTMARDLVNEPANVLYPAEFARRVGALKKVGVAVEVLDVKAMRSSAWARCSASVRARRGTAARW